MNSPRYEAARSLIATALFNMDTPAGMEKARWCLRQAHGEMTLAGEIPKQTFRQWLRWRLRDLADRTLVPLGIMHYSGCWCEKCQSRWRI